MLVEDPVFSGDIQECSNSDGFVESPKTVMPDSIPAEDEIFDRHPEVIKSTGFRLSPE
ncbi:MAG: hypothetical protein JRJ82_21675 [Deltaproteobacteria bacterium]|nr:hypothetical protein [Deltaproteobacteria bacterium]